MLNEDVKAFIGDVASGQLSAPDIARWLAVNSLRIYESDREIDRMVVADIDAALGEAPRRLNGFRHVVGVARELALDLGVGFSSAEDATRSDIRKLVGIGVGLDRTFTIESSSSSSEQANVSVNESTGFMVERVDLVRSP